MYVDVHYYTYTGYPNAYYPDALIEIKYDKAHYSSGFPVAKAIGLHLQQAKTPQRETIRAKSR